MLKYTQRCSLSTQQALCMGQDFFWTVRATPKMRVHRDMCLDCAKLNMHPGSLSDTHAHSPFHFTKNTKKTKKFSPKCTPKYWNLAPTNLM